MQGRGIEGHRRVVAIDCNRKYSISAYGFFNEGKDVQTIVYLIEKSTGLRDENGVELFYAVSARLTRAKAEKDFHEEIAQGTVRVRKIKATK